MEDLREKAPKLGFAEVKKERNPKSRTEKAWPEKGIYLGRGRMCTEEEGRMARSK